MYVYEKKSFKRKATVLIGISGLLVIACFILIWTPEKKDTPVSSVGNNLPVLTIPSALKEKETAVRPYKEQAKLARPYFDLNKSEEELTHAVVEFEGIYRPNQGADYTLDNTSFEVVAVFSGKVSDVREDSLFGKTVVIENKEYSITYQSLSDIQVSLHDEIRQGDVIAKAGENMYDPSLGNHLHLVVMKDQKLIDPEILFSKTTAQIE